MKRGVVWQGVAWCGVVWRGVAWCGVVWRGVVWCGAMWYGNDVIDQNCENKKNVSGNKLK